MRKVVAVVLLAAISLAAAADTLKELESFPFEARLLQPDQVRDLSVEDLQRLRAILFGRHGRIFPKGLQDDFLRRSPWYKPDPGYSHARLNETEKQNADLLHSIETPKHQTLMLSDMCVLRDREVTLELIGKPALEDLRILRAEIEAVHGKSFPLCGQLRDYFEQRYRYRADPSYSPRSLSAVEKKNLATFLEAEKRLRGVAVVPGQADLWRSRLLRTDDLKGLNVQELRVLRHEFAARRGKRFAEKWLQSYFGEQWWYEPSSDDPKLSETEEANIRTILASENAASEALVAVPLAKELLDGMLYEELDLLREELYARLGKPFPTGSAQAQYFRGLAWYKPDPAFSYNSLSETAKLNVLRIKSYRGETARHFASKCGC